MSYAIMRCTKLKTFANVAASAQHCFRERETFNADENRTPNNRHHAASSSAQLLATLREKLPEKRRKDAVIAVEYMLTPSPEWWQTATPEMQQAWEQNSLDWVRTKYGAQNVLAATLHTDETTPHLSVYVVPITQDGRLSARDFIGGRPKLRADQTTYAQMVADLGLKRGIKGSKAKHVSIRQYYARANQAEAFKFDRNKVTYPAPEGMDRFKISEYGNKVAENVIDQLEDAIKNQMAKQDEIENKLLKAKEKLDSIRFAKTDAYLDRLESERQAAKLSQLKSMFELLPIEQQIDLEQKLKTSREMPLESAHIATDSSNVGWYHQEGSIGLEGENRPVPERFSDANQKKKDDSPSFDPF